MPLFESFNYYSWIVRIMGTFPDVKMHLQLSSIYFQIASGAVLVLTELDNDGIEVRTEGPPEEADKLWMEFTRRWNSNRETAQYPW